jgi:hypothetical protein
MVGRVVLTLSLLAVACPVLADSKVAVLGLRSIEGDDDVANAITERLRSAAGTVPEWSVSSAAVSMAQMSLAHGCEEIDAACLSDIASGLRVDIVIYGTLRRNSAREDYEFALNVSMYDANAATIAKSVDDTVPRGEDGEAAIERAQKIVSRLSSTVQGGTISVQANIMDADVRINGQQVGRTRDGALRLGGLLPGQYRIEIVKDGYAPHVSTVTVAEGLETSIAAVLAPLGAQGIASDVDSYSDGPQGGGHRLEWLGWTLIGAGAVSLAAMGLSMKVITDIDDDSGKRQYSDAVARGNEDARALGDDDGVFDDVCVAARSGMPYPSYGLTAEDARDVADKCDTADTMEVLQYVFLGIGAAAGIGGLVLVLTADDSPSDDRGARDRALTLRPHFGPTSGGISASLRF